jgi:lipid-binding SYLF domain-containing protein
MNTISRRLLITGAACGALLTTACSNGVGGSGAAEIDARVDESLRYLFNTYPATTELRDKSVGMLVMPLVTEAGFGFGGAYGRGALRVGGVTVDYYSSAEASFGLQIGAQQYAHVLFFMTEDALQNFRRSPGWVAGADLQYAVKNNAENISTDTTILGSPVIAVVFGQAGLIAGATIEGTKYSRIIP